MIVTITKISTEINTQWAYVGKMCPKDVYAGQLFNEDLRK